jgi:ATP/maltotriose-dependent transcriptional regulator MalT
MRLARLRVHSQMVEVRAEHLRCSEAEAAEFLRAATGGELPGTEVQQAMARTEG